MSNIDSIITDINRSVNSYNRMVYFSNNYIYADNTLAEAYNSMLDVYQLQKCFSIDGNCPDGGLFSAHKKILDLMNDINRETDQMRDSMKKQLQNIDNQKAKLEAAKRS